MYFDEAVSGTVSLNTIVPSDPPWDTRLDLRLIEVGYLNLLIIRKLNPRSQQLSSFVESSSERQQVVTTPDTGASSGTDVQAGQLPPFIVVDLAGKPAYRCVTCDKTFKRKSDLNRHLRTSLKHASRRFSCSICGKSYTRKHVLTGHTCAAGAAANTVSQNGA